MTQNYIVPIPLGTIDVTTITAITWTAFDTGAIPGACFMLRITNDSDSDIFISYDGVGYHEYIASGDRIEINFQTNSSPSGYVSKVKKGTILYVQGEVGQTGNIYLAGYYNNNI